MTRASRAGDTGPTRVVFVNSGILGQSTFSKFVREAMALEPAIEPHHINLSEQLTIRERVVRRAMCGRLWRDGWLGISNLDLARFRAARQQVLRDAHPDEYRRRLRSIIHDAAAKRDVV